MFKKTFLAQVIFTLLFGVSIIACSKNSSSTSKLASSEPLPYTKELNIYNWGDYIAPGVIKSFEKETGIKVSYDTFDSNELLQAKLVAGSSGYDIVVPSAPWADVQIRAGLLQKLHKELIPNLKNENPSVQRKLAVFDPGNNYLVNWALIYDTLGINTVKVNKALGNMPLPDNKWDLLFKPEYMAKLSTCGVTIIDSPSEIIPQTLAYLGKNPYSAKKEDYIEVDKVLKAIRPYVTRIASSGHIDDLANGTICMAFAYSGDMNIARKRAIENKTNQDVKALLPKTSVILEPDSMAIPIDAKNVRNANLFMNYMLRPEVQATTTNIMLYPTANSAAQKYINSQVLENQGYVFPTDAELESMEIGRRPNLLVNRMQTRCFSRFKTDNY